MLITAIVVLFCACQTNRNQTHRPSKYQKVKVRHTPWKNASTSQNTTYYIKKHSTRKSHDGTTIKSYKGGRNKVQASKKQQSHVHKRRKH